MNSVNMRRLVRVVGVLSGTALMVLVIVAFMLDKQGGSGYPETLILVLAGVNFLVALALIQMARQKSRRLSQGGD